MLEHIRKDVLGQKSIQSDDFVDLLQFLKNKIINVKVF
jgi:hypothetical protein